MRAFCHTYKGRFVTFVELFALGCAIYASVIYYAVTLDDTFKGHEGFVFEAFMAFAAVFWGVVCAALCSGGGAPSIILHRLFHVSPQQIEDYQAWRKKPARR